MYKTKSKMADINPAVSTILKVNRLKIPIERYKLSD